MRRDVVTLDWVIFSGRFAVAVLVLGMFLHAPFAHMHVDDPTHAHAGFGVHVHLPAAAPSHDSAVTAAIDHEEPYFLDWLATSGTDDDVAPALPAAIEGPVLVPLARLLTPSKARSHDPPDRRHRSPRAPPA